MQRKCNHCKRMVEVDAHVCPYCGEDPWSMKTRAQQAKLDQEMAAREEKRKQKRAAKIEKYGYWGYLWRKVVKWIIIIAVVYVFFTLINK